MVVVPASNARGVRARLDPDEVHRCKRMDKLVGRATRRR